MLDERNLQIEWPMVVAKMNFHRHRIGIDVFLAKSLELSLEEVNQFALFIVLSNVLQHGIVENHHDI